MLDAFFIFDVFIELEMMKERFAKLLLGEDLSGGGKGVSSALAISNAITNLAGNSLIDTIIENACIDFIARISDMGLCVIF